MNTLSNMLLNKIMGAVCCMLCVTATGAQAQDVKGMPQKTAFQTSTAWMPQTDVRADIAIVYGVDMDKGVSVENRIKSWREKGYQVQFMTGIAWGSYNDYFLGGWDGKNHLDVAQVMQNGETINHGVNMPYVVPEASFIKYMQEGVVKRVIDAGVTTIFLEEPEFWMRAGYSVPFKEAWQKYYGFSWRPQHESAENAYLSHKLKYHLYYEAIKQVSNYAKAYGKSKGKNIKVMIPTHSLINYASWGIVSPEASLASLPGIDGYIAQVWTGTSRTPVYYRGVAKERVFENAFLEYGCVTAMTAPTGRKVYLLTDPVEDRPRDWADFKRNYEATFTAKLLYPMVNNYEVMPWPERIYTEPYSVPNSDKKVLIPPYYATQMQVMINALNNMPLSSNKVSGTQGIGVLMGNSMMFQGFPEFKGYSDVAFSNFYGQTLPLLEKGVPVQMVHMENLGYAAALKDIKVLVMSYSNMKPTDAGVHKALAEWVRGGGVLVYAGRDDDPYQRVQEWWNTGGNAYAAPSEHLFKIMDMPANAEGRYKVGAGAVYVVREDPKEFSTGPTAAYVYQLIITKAYEDEAKAGRLELKNSYYLARGPYDIVSVLGEDVTGKPYTVRGPVVDLYNPQLPVLAEKVVQPGEQALLYNLDRVADKKKPQVLAAAARVYDERRAGNSYSFTVKSPAGTENSIRILLPAKPVQVQVSAEGGKLQQAWDAGSSTLWLGFKNNTEGVHVKISWRKG